MKKNVKKTINRVSAVVKIEKKKAIKEFLKKLKEQDVNSLGGEIEEGEVNNFFKNFAITCKKCGSSRIWVSWEYGSNYTEYIEGEKVIKCLDCGNAVSWSE